MKKLVILIVLIIVIIAAGALWWKNGVQPKNSADNTSQIFVIRKGEGVREIGNSLKSKGLIKDPIVFFLLTKRLGFDKDLEAGDFRLSPSMSLYGIVQNLTHGTIDAWITIPEGIRALEIADILEKNIPNYKPDWRNALVANEGYLFPDTYLIPKDADINLVISLMRNNFDKKYETIDVKNSNLSKNEIIKIASMVEREAKFPEDRPMVASVILNRLKIGMKLDIDATVQYAVANVQCSAPGQSNIKCEWWKKELTADDLNIVSAYNTYKNATLPPTPISNPGLFALKAVASPAQTNYLYYVSDKSGHLHFAQTIQQHNENIKKYGL